MKYKIQTYEFDHDRNPNWVITKESDWYELDDKTFPWEVDNAISHNNDKTTKKIVVWKDDCKDFLEILSEQRIRKN